MFDPGSEVIIGNSITATIAGALIKEGGSVTYECVWWDGNARQSQWINAHEIKLSNDQKFLAVGFHSAGAKVIQ